MEFKLWVVRDADETLVFQDATDELREIFGEDLKEYTFTLKSPLTQAQATEADRLMWGANAVGGLVRDEARRPAATVQAFLASWTLAEPLNMVEFEKLPPVLAQAIYSRVEGSVYPNPLASRHYRSWLAKQGNGAEPPSSTP